MGSVLGRAEAVRVRSPFFSASAFLSNSHSSTEMLSQSGRRILPIAEPQRPYPNSSTWDEDKEKGVCRMISDRSPSAVSKAFAAAYSSDWHSGNGLHCFCSSGVSISGPMLCAARIWPGERESHRSASRQGACCVI